MGEDELREAVRALHGGEVIGIPTDTVYGLGCRPDDAAAVERIYAIKRRPAGLELTLLAASVTQIESHVRIDARARRLMERFWPGPLSVVLPVGSERLAVPRSGTTLSVRVPDHPLLRELLAATGPLATTSANRHGEPAATSAQEVRAALGDAVGVVLDGGVAGGTASTVVDCTGEEMRVLRGGPINEVELQSAARGS